MPSVNRHVALLFHMGERFVNRELAGTGITNGTAPLLLELRDGGDRNPTALALAIGVDKAHITRSLRPLSRCGYVEMRPDPTDGRMITVSLTEQGRAAAAVAERAVQAWLEVVGRGVPTEDLRTTDAVMEAFYANAVQHFTETTKPTHEAVARNRADLGVTRS